MANASITTLITGLALVTTDGTATDSFQNDVIYELARGMYPGILGQTGASFIAAVADTARYTLPSGAVLPLLVFYDINQIMRIRKDEAWSFDALWREAPAQVVVGYVQDPEDRSSFALIPPPKRAGDAIGAYTPFTAGWAGGNIAVIYSAAVVAFTGTTYDDLKLPIAFEVIARELARDSNHQDKVAADVAHNMASLFFSMFTPLGYTP